MMGVLDTIIRYGVSIRRKLIGLRFVQRFVVSVLANTI